MTLQPHEITGDRVVLYLTLARCFDNVLQPSMIDFPPWWQVPTGLRPVLASTLHLVDALARMQLTASSYVIRYVSDETDVTVVTVASCKLGGCIVPLRGLVNQPKIAPDYDIRQSRKLNLCNRHGAQSVRVP